MSKGQKARQTWPEIQAGRGVGEDAAQEES